VLRRVGVANVLVVSTPARLAWTPLLRVDTGGHGGNLAGRGVHRQGGSLRARRVPGAAAASDL